MSNGGFCTLDANYCRSIASKQASKQASTAALQQASKQASLWQDLQKAQFLWEFQNPVPDLILYLSSSPSSYLAFAIQSIHRTIRIIKICILYRIFCMLYFVFCILYFVFCILYFVFCICHSKAIMGQMVSSQFVRAPTHNWARSYRLSHHCSHLILIQFHLLFLV